MFHVILPHNLYVNVFEFDEEGQVTSGWCICKQKRFSVVKPDKNFKYLGDNSNKGYDVLVDAGNHMELFERREQKVVRIPYEIRLLPTSKIIEWANKQ